MPLPSYTWVHGNLTDEQRQNLVDWAQMVRLSYRVDEASEPVELHLINKIISK